MDVLGRRSGKVTQQDRHYVRDEITETDSISYNFPVNTMLVGTLQDHPMTE